MPGIMPDPYESADAGPGERMEFVDVEFVPVTAMSVSMKQRPDLGLAFISPAVRGREKDPEPGCVVDVDASVWRPGRDPENGRRVLLDTSVDSDRVLLYLPPSCDRILLSVKDPRSFVSTREDGLPVLCSASRASALRDAAKSSRRPSRDA